MTGKKIQPKNPAAKAKAAGSKSESKTTGRKAASIRGNFRKSARKTSAASSGH